MKNNIPHTPVIICIICNCVLGCLAVVAIQKATIHFDKWPLLFFMILPLAMCTGRCTEHSKDNDGREK